VEVDGRGLGGEYAGDVVDEVLEGVEFLLDELGSTEAGMLGSFAQFFQTVFVHSSLLGVVSHAFQVALLFHFLDDLVDVAFNVATHTADLLQCLPHLGPLDLADLPVPLRLLIQELQVFVPDVGDIVQHFCVEIADAFTLAFVPCLHALDGFALRLVVLLQLA
jgi:hypothetical protein